MYSLNNILLKKYRHKFLKVSFLNKASVRCSLFFSPNDNSSKSTKK